MALEHQSVLSLGCEGSLALQLSVFVGQCCTCAADSFSAVSALSWGG